MLLTPNLKQLSDDDALEYLAYNTTIIKQREEANGYISLNEEIIKLDITDLSDIKLIALLRNTWSLHTYLSGWGDLLERVKVQLESRNRPVDFLLKGLINKTLCHSLTCKLHSKK